MKDTTQDMEHAEVSILRNKILLRHRLKTGTRICNILLLVLLFGVCAVFTRKSTKLAISVLCVSTAIIICNRGIPFNYRIPARTFDALDKDDVNALPLFLDALMSGWVDNEESWVKKVSELLTSECVVSSQWNAVDLRIIAQYSGNPKLPLASAIQNVLPTGEDWAS